MVNRITKYRDYKRHIIDEIICVFAHRADKLVVRKRYPYEFKTIEEYEPGKKGEGLEDSHLKRLVQEDGVLRQLYYYPHRNQDGLIYREEKILRKTIEKYKGRIDHLIYRSVTFDPDAIPEGRDLVFKENHSGKEVLILKMTQKFELDPARPPEQQLRKIVFDQVKKKIFEYYHYRENNIKEDCREHSLDSIQSVDSAEKEDVSSEEYLKRQELNNIKKNCVNQINTQEASAAREFVEIKPDQMLELTIFDKARERAKKDQEIQGEEGKKQEEEDYLAPVIAKLQLDKAFANYKKKMPFDANQARLVQTTAFQMHKERIKTRAKIIQERLDNEISLIQSKYVKNHEINYFRIKRLRILIK